MLAEKQETLEQRIYQRIVEWKEYSESEIFKQKVLNLVRSWLEQPYFEEEEVNCGYDVSFYPKKTNKKLKDFRLETLGELLKEFNGYTEATYCSGHGVRCQEYQDNLEEFLRNEVYAFVKKGFSEEEFEKAHCDLDIVIDRLSELDCDEYSLTEKFRELKL